MIQEILNSLHVTQIARYASTQVLQYSILTQYTNSPQTIMCFNMTLNANSRLCGVITGHSKIYQILYKVEKTKVQINSMDGGWEVQ